MNFQFSFKHMDSSIALQDYATGKIKEKVEKFVSKPSEINVTFSVERHNHTAHVTIRGGDGFNVDVQHTCGDMYASVDNLVDKLAAQLKRTKEKLKDHKQDRLVKKIETLSRTSSGSEANSVDAEDILKYEAARRKAYG